jgi:hypothetical protein
MARSPLPTSNPACSLQVPPDLNAFWSSSLGRPLLVLVTNFVALPTLTSWQQHSCCRQSLQHPTLPMLSLRGLASSSPPPAVSQPSNSMSSATASRSGPTSVRWRSRPPCTSSTGRRSPPVSHSTPTRTSGRDGRGSATRSCTSSCASEPMPWPSRRSWPTPWPRYGNNNTLAQVGSCLRLVVCA